MDFVRPADFAFALKEAEAVGLRFPSGDETLDDLIAAGRAQSHAGNHAGAMRWLGQAVARSDDPDLWAELGLTLLRLTPQNSGQKQTYRRQALAAGINAYLRAETSGNQVNGLVTLALAYKALGRGRDMIPVLRLAEDIAPRKDTARLLDDAIAKYGFRVVDSTVESDSAAPRICVEFSEELQRSGVNYADYVKGADPGFAASPNGRKLCLEGVDHGQRYRVTLRRGLPSADGEALVKDVELTHYVRDRSPSVRFPGRAYVLAKTELAAVPVETVNLETVDLRLRRVSSRNLIRSFQDGYFGRPLAHWQDENFSADIAAEVWTGSAEVENNLNQNVTTRLPLADVLSDQPAGVYALSARIPGIDPYEDQGATQWFVLTDLGISSMSGADGLHVQVQGLSDARPRADVAVTLISNANEVLAETQTDVTGYAHFEAGLTRGRGSLAPALITVQNSDTDFAFLSLRDAAFDLSDRGVEGRPAPGPVDAFLATDRGAYRVGEQIQATVLARDSQASAIESIPLVAILSRPDGVEYSRHLSDGGKMGGHIFTLPIGESAPRGTWRLDIKSDPEAAALVSRQILVEDFLPERIDFTQVLSSGQTPMTGQSTEMDLEARYLFGAPGSNLKVEGELRLREVETLAGWNGYQFGRYDRFSGVQSSYFGGVETDTTGRVTFSVDVPAAPAGGKPFEAVLTTRVADGAARPVERSLTLPVAPTGAVLGIRPLFEEEVAEGSEAAFELIALSAELSPQPMKVTWSLNKIETRYQWYQLYGNWNWEPTTSRTRVATGEVMLGEEPVQVSHPVEWGRYELVVERSDGARLTAAVDFYAGWYAPADATATPDRLEVALDAPSYQPGDEARLRIVSRTNGTALVSVLSNRLIERHAVEVVAGESIVPLKVSEAWGSGAYVTAMVVRPSSPTDKATRRAPVRALGLAHATVIQPGQELKVEIDVPDVVRPRGRQVARLSVEGQAEGEEVWVTLAAVDLGILNLTGFKSPNPSDHYHGQRRLGMELRDLYGRLIDPGNGAMGLIRSGGDAETGLRMQSPPPTQDLVAIFSGPLAITESGYVDVPIDLPAFNGTVRLMAIAWSKRAVGQSERDMLVRDPVVVSAAVPRFLAPGDQSRARIELVHADGPSGEMTLSVVSSGTELGVANSKQPFEVFLTDQGKSVVDVPLLAEAVGDPSLVLTLTTPSGLELSQTLRVPVRANDPVVAQTRRFTLAGGDQFLFSADVFAGLREGTARAVLSAGPLAKFDVPGLLAELDQYPYGCTEQVTSKALPLLYLSSVAQAAGLGSGPQVEGRINAAIRKILTRQAASGAFGLWRAQSGDFWLDAYASDFLSRARSQGFTVPEQAFAQAMDNLRNRINYAPDFDTGGEDIAYALMVLAREGAAAMGDLRYYADVKAQAFATPLAAAQLGAALAAYGDQRRADRLFARAAQLLGQKGRENNVWRADYGTYHRDSAAVLALVTEARSEAISRDFLVSRVARSVDRLSTQEAAWTLLAAHALVKTPEGSGLVVNGVPQSGPFVQILDRQALAPMEITAATGEMADLTLTTIGVPLVPPPASGYGLTLERNYYTMDGLPIDRKTFEVGERFVTVLRVSPHEDLGARLMINDPLPAGFEIDNPTLLRSGDLRELDWLRLDEAEHAEFRSDRFLAAIDLRGTGSRTLAYVTRAVTPGQFHLPAASVEDMYRPAYRAHTEAGSIGVK